MYNLYRKPNRGQFGAGFERYTMMDRETVKNIINEYVEDKKIFKNLKELYDKEYIEGYGGGSCLWSLSYFSIIFNEYNYQYEYNRKNKCWGLKERYV